MNEVQCVCCSSIKLGTKFSEPVQNFWTSTNFSNQYQIFWTGTIILNQYKSFNVCQFHFFLVSKKQKEKYFLHLWSSLYLPSSLPLHSTHLTYYSLPALPTSQPLFFLPQCLPCEPWTTDLSFSSGFMSWCLTTEPWRFGWKFPYFFNYICTVVVIHFLKLFKSNTYVGPSPSQS